MRSRGHLCGLADGLPESGGLQLTATLTGLRPSPTSHVRLVRTKFDSIFTASPVQAWLRSVRDSARKEWPLRGSTTWRSAIADRHRPSGEHPPLAAPFGPSWGRGICDSHRLDPLAVFVLAAAPGVGTL